MKTVFRHILLAFLALSTVAIYAQDDKDKFNQKDAQGRKQGKWRKFHRNGNLRYIGQFKDDKPVGKFMYYYEDGRPFTIIEHRAKGVSYATSFHANEKPMAFGKYVNQKRDSIWTFYNYKHGIKIATESYIVGKKYGIHKVFYPATGKLAETKTYENDVATGIWTTYYENGNKKRECTLNNGILEGKAYYYYTNGKKQIDGRYKKDVKHGLWTFFKQSGGVEKQVKYVNGKPEGQKDDPLLPEPEMKLKQDRLSPNEVRPGFDPYDQ